MDRSIEKVVGCILSLFHPKSVIDVGCGDGAWLREFQKHGIQNIHGIDSREFEHAQFWMQNERYFTPANMDGVRIRSKIKFDLVICVNFLHNFMEEQAAGTFHDLLGLGDTILFSAAVPGEVENGKTGKWASDWGKQFRANGFLPLDCIRPSIWGDGDVEVGYRQNILLYVREDALARYPKLLWFHMLHGKQMIYDVVHPENWRRMKEELEKVSDRFLRIKPRKVLYTFYHGIAFAWVLAHKLTKHPKDDAYLLLGDSWDWCYGRPYFRTVIERFCKKGIFKEIYTYPNASGRNCSSIEETEREIQRNIQKSLDDQNCDLKSFDAIYSHTDAEDTIGIYFSLNQIRYCWFEGCVNNHKIYTEKAICGIYANAKGYCEALLKHKTIFGKYKYESFVLFPDSDKEGIPEEKCTFFDPIQAVSMLFIDEKNMIREIFRINELPNSESTTWVCVQSKAIPILFLWPRFSFLHKRYKDAHELYLSCIQVLFDYYVPKGSLPVLKLHPGVPIAQDALRRYFNGSYALSPLFSMPLTKVLRNNEVPDYAILLRGTSPGQFSLSSHVIHAGISWYFSFFMHKYVIVLYMLKFIECLYANAGERFGWLGDSANMDGLNLNDLIIGINEMIQVQFNNVPSTAQFPNTPNNVQSDYTVLQTSPETIEQEASSHDFIIYTDVWETLSIPQLLDISKKFYVGIVKISKKPVKPVEDILVPLQDEYIFFVSKDDSYGTQLESFTAFKENKAMGIELSARIVSIEEYTG